MSPLTLFTAIAIGWSLFEPKPKVSDIDGAWGWAPDSTIAYAARVFLSGPLGPRDVIRYTTYKDGVLMHDVRTTRTDTTFSFPAPAYDSTSAYKVFARAFRGTSPSGAFQGDSTTFTRGPAPEPPAPVVDSVRVVPSQVSLGAGGKQQFTAAVFSR